MADRMKSGGDFCSAILCTKPETKQKAVLVNRFPDSQKMKKGKCLIWFVNSINPCTRQTYTFVLMFSELCLGLESRMTNEKWMAKDRIDRKKDVIKTGWSEICTAFSESRGIWQRVLGAFCPTSNNVSVIAKCFNCRFKRIRSTRFGTPLNLLAMGHQAFSILCVICQLFSCRRTRYFFVLFIYIIPLREMCRNERLLCRF